MEPLEADDPRQVGRFEIVARLGAGGMGRVYLARSSSGEQFALKMIHQFLSDDMQFRRRFEREVMAARKVTGENTAALVDADPDARPPWMATEYVDGPTLSELIDRGGPLTLSSSAWLAAGMAKALISIHAAGLVHRDLKPSNVLMSATGAKLIDFGIAQASGASSLTMTGLVTGSAGFMSPEQAQAERVTEASDVFALGTVLYFAATGLRPFGEGSMISVTYRVVHADPELSLIRDEGMRDLIEDCLQKDPRRRPTPQEIYERCPGIADGTWRALKKGDTQPTFAINPVGPRDPSGPGGPNSGMLLPPPVPLNSGHQPVLVAGGTRRSTRGRQGLLQYASLPWLAIPAVAGVILLAGVPIVLTLGNGSDSDGRPGTSVTSGPEDPIGEAGGQVPDEELPIGPDGVRPTRRLTPVAGSTLKPTVKATTKATTRPTTTKTTRPSPSATDEEPDDPTEPTETEAEPTKEPTPDPTTPPATTPAATSTGNGGTGGGTGVSDLTAGLIGLLPGL